MTINYTTLLGLAKPVTGTESGAWGDIVNDQITSLLEDAVANAATINVGSGNVTLTDNNGAADQSRMAILLVTGSPGTSRNIVAPSISKWYIVRNGSDSSVVVKGSATTGVTIPTGSDALVFWNGSDFEIAAVAGPASSTDNAVVRYDGTTGKVVQNSGVTIDDSNNVAGVVNLGFTGTGNRITGDFSNATLASRVMFQTSTTNGATVVSVLPNGTSTDAALVVYNGNDPANSASGSMYANAADVRIAADKLGTGTYLPMTFYTGGSERVRIDTSGNVGIGANATNRLSLTYNGGTGEATFGPNSTSGSTFLTLGTSNAGSYSERMRINSSGNVGIGTADPANKFVVSNGGGAGLEITPNGLASNPILVSYNRATSAYGQLSFGSDFLVFCTNGTTEQARITSAGLLQFNSGYGSVATAYGCRAWVNFNGTGTPAIRASGNVSSITDNGTGDYTINFTAAMSDANYCVVGMIGDSSTAAFGVFSAPRVSSPTTSAFRCYTTTSAPTNADYPFVHIAIFR